jgi:hypothetical protein
MVKLIGALGLLSEVLANSAFRFQCVDFCVNRESGLKFGVSSQKADEGQQSGSSAMSVNIASMLLPIYAVGSPNRS